MIRNKLAGRIRKDRITWRSHEVSRIEAFSDAVFAFAITLLIISLEVPKSFDELLKGVRGFIPFAICFAMLFQVWVTQNLFFRRYGLHDTITMVLNGMLLFVVLFFVYPLKFLFGGLLTGGFSFSRPEQLVQLFYIYGSGFAAIYVLFALMYWHACRREEELKMAPGEIFETRTHVYRNLLMAGVGVLSMAIASFGYQYGFFAGMVYMLIGPIVGFTHGIRGKTHRQKFGTTMPGTQPDGPEAPPYGGQP